MVPVRPGLSSECVVGPRPGSGGRPRGWAFVGRVAPGRRHHPTDAHVTGECPGGRGRVPVCPLTGAGGVDLIVERRSGRTRLRAWPRRVAAPHVAWPPRERRRPHGRAVGHGMARRAPGRPQAVLGMTARPTGATGRLGWAPGSGVREPGYDTTGDRNTRPGMMASVVPALLMPLERAAVRDDDATLPKTREISGVSFGRVWPRAHGWAKLSAPTKYHSQWR